MKSNHLTDQEIQEFLFGQSTVDKDINSHIESCEECKIKIVNYKTIAGSIKSINSPSFDFDLSGMVMEKVIAEKPRVKLSMHLIISFLLGVISFAVITVCANYVVVETNFLEYITKDVDSFAIIILSVSLIIGMIYTIEILYRHKKMINMINAK